MNAVPPQESLQSILPAARIQNLLPVRYRPHWICIQAFILCILWRNVIEYDKITLCFDGLLFVTDVYRVSLDKDQCVALLAVIIFGIFMIFDATYLFGVAVLVVYVSLLKPISWYITHMLMKAICDVGFVYILRVTNSRLLKILPLHRFTDFLMLSFTIHSHLMHCIRHPNFDSVEDFIVHTVFMMHIYVYVMEEYTIAFLAITILLTCLWMYFKSQVARRRENILFPINV